MANLRRDADGNYSLTSFAKPSMAKQPRDRTIALSDTLVTRADGSQYIIPANTRSRRKATYKRTAPSALTTPRTRDLDLMAAMGTIHTEA